MPRIIFLDLETRRHAKDLRPDDEEAGWDELRAGKGGASALCLYDTKEEWVYLYDDSPRSLATAVRHIESADVVVGYCSGRFDLPVIEGLFGRNLRIRQHVDIYQEILRECTQRNIKTSVGDLKLDTICRKNIGRGKIEHGSHAKDLAEQNRWAELFNYCSDDVHLTHDLFKYICRHGGVHLVGNGWVTLSPTLFPKEWIEE